MINSNAFNYINVLDKAADASYIRHQAISNNLANVSTPLYKRQDVAFDTELKRALGRNRWKSMDAKVGDIKLSRLNPRPYKDYPEFSYRLDRNNVDPETENVMLVENTIKYNGLMNSLTAEFQNLQAVMRK